MLNCIAGALLACSNIANMQIDGPVGYNTAAPVYPPFNYALYAVPLQQPRMPLFFPVRRA